MIHDFLRTSCISDALRIRSDTYQLTSRPAKAINTRIVPPPRRPGGLLEAIG